MATVIQAVEQTGAEPDTAFPDRRRTAFTRFCYALLIAAIIIFAAIRFHLRHTPLERDGGEYAYIGQLMLQGVPPYKLAANMKLPGTYAAYAAIMAVFGQTPAGIHIGVIVVTSLSAIFLFLIGKRLYGELTGAVAGASYIFFAARPGVLGIDGQATHFVDVMALAGIWLLLRAMWPDEAAARNSANDDHSARTALFFASGVCFGLSFLMKQPGILFGVFAGLYWLWHELRGLTPPSSDSENRAPWGPQLRRIALRGGALVTGAVLPYAITCLIMLKAGVFQNFWFWTWTYARAYGVLNSSYDALRNLRIFLPWAVKPFALWTIALVGLFTPLFSRWARAHAGFVTGFFLTSCLAVCPGFYFRPHYFIVLLPAGALCIAVAVDCIYRSLCGAGLPRLAFAPVVLFVLIWITGVYGQWKSLYHLDPVALSWKMYEKEQDFPVDVTLADFIKARSAPGDQIDILGSEPEICFYTRLRCATSYLYMYPLLEKQRFAGQMQRDYMHQLESARPRFLIYVDNERSWGWKPTMTENQQFLDWGWNFAHNGYRLIYQTPAPNVGLYPDHLWGEHAAYYVFERN